MTIDERDKLGFAFFAAVTIAPFYMMAWSLAIFLLRWCLR